MSRARLVITAVVMEGRSQGEVARAYGVSQGWVSRLVARYREEDEAASGPRSRRPKTSPNAIASQTAELIAGLRKDLAGPGPGRRAAHDLLAPGTSPPGEGFGATVSRYLARAGLVTPDPAKRPKSSYLRFAAQLPPGRTWSELPLSSVPKRMTRTNGARLSLPVVVAGRLMRSSNGDAVAVLAIRSARAVPAHAAGVAALSTIKRQLCRAG
jgi:hypothetical protein